MDGRPHLADALPGFVRFISNY